MKKTGKNKSPVRLKGVGDSVCLTVDPAQPMDEIQKEITKVFNRLKNPTTNTRITVDFGEETGHDTLLQQIEKFIKETYSVESVTRLVKKRPPNEEMIRQRDMEQSWYHYHSEVLMLAGRVRSGQKVTAKKHLLLLGDVNPGGEVFSGGDIIVLGSLCGTAIAGQPDNENVIVLALDFRPTQVQIGGRVAAGFPHSPTKVVEYAHVENGVIVVEDYLMSNPFGRMPWPQVR